MPWMMFIFSVLMALSTNGAGEGMNGSDLAEVNRIWRASQPPAASQVPRVKRLAVTQQRKVF